MDLQLRHLRNLCAIADAGSLNRAATALGLPQPALSRQVRRLEQLLGGPLFVRDCNGVRPTAFGVEVINHAESIVRVADRFGEQLRAHRLKQRSGVRVCWATSALHEPLLHCLRQLPGGGRPHIVVADSSRSLAGLLRTGDVDVALRDRCTSEEPADTRCASTEQDGDPVSEIVWAESPVLLALAADHTLATAPAITMADLAEEDWISVYGPDRCHEELRRICGGFGFTPRISHDVPVSGPRSDVIRHQRCVTLVQAMRPMGPGVVRREIADLPLRVRHAVAFRRDSHFAAQIPLLVELLGRAYQELASGTPGRPAGQPTAMDVRAAGGPRAHPSCTDQ
ncbi:LysR family transcriptional regulator [Streptomyces sp. P1-3]|uniref:LysR family transcriptional regulator n=1 Tax=Streptomyces sp. P1-3 TaxID=3421658 RepID=UPI003D366061